LLINIPPCFGQCPGITAPTPFKSCLSFYSLSQGGAGETKMGPKAYFGPSIIFSPVLCQASLTETQSDFPLINDTVLLSLPKLFEPFWFGHFKGKAYIIQKKSPEKVIF